MSSTNGHWRRLTSLLGGGTRSRLTQWSGYIPRVAALEEGLTQQSDFDLKKMSLSLRYRARSGEPEQRRSAGVQEQKQQHERSAPARVLRGERQRRGEHRRKHAADRQGEGEQRLPFDLVRSDPVHEEGREDHVDDRDVEAFQTG